MIHQWELDKAAKWTTEQLKNYIWMQVSCNMGTPASVSVEAMREELRKRGEEPKGYHNT